MRVTILGCGTSGGVPRVGGKGGGGEWGAADPTDPRNRRRRCSILVQDRGKTLLVDTSPDLRDQLLDAEVERIDAVLWTHEHADQVHGIDDMRPYMLRQGPIEAWSDERTRGILLQRFRYCFEAEGNGFYNPIYQHHEIAGPFNAAGVAIVPKRAPVGPSLPAAAITSDPACAARSDARTGRRPRGPVRADGGDLRQRPGRRRLRARR